MTLCILFSSPNCSHWFLASHIHTYTHNLYLTMLAWDTFFLVCNTIQWKNISFWENLIRIKKLIAYKETKRLVFLRRFIRKNLIRTMDLCFYGRVFDRERHIGIVHTNTRDSRQLQHPEASSVSARAKLQPTDRPMFFFFVLYHRTCYVRDLHQHWNNRSHRPMNSFRMITIIAAIMCSIVFVYIGETTAIWTT